MGTVYLCEHAVLERRFAVKVLRADLAADAELVDRFRNEAIAASRIGQENVVDVVDFGADEDGSLYYVMEALDGRSLGAVIRDEGPLPVLRALDLLEQICRALAAAHARGVVHRDVKPDNVFLVRKPDGREHAKVIDFGISQVPGAGERITRAGAIIGTPEYMAPEQASGAVIDHRADVYAAGVLAFEMLTGQLPLEAATPLATIAAHRTLTPDPPSWRVAGVPPEVDALVLRALAKRPADRYATMDELAGEVARIRAGISHEFGHPSKERLGARPAGATPPDGTRGPSGPGRPSRPRGETVALPETREVERHRMRSARRAAVALAIGVGVLVAAGAGWERWAARDATPTPTAAPTATATSTSTSTPTPTPLSTAGFAPSPVVRARVAGPVAAPAPIPVDVATPSGPVLVGAAPQPGAPAVEEETRPAKAKAHRPGRQGEPAEADLKDPYADDAKLKDPFQ
jgi:serine/threonine-protein kinase